MPRPRRAPTPPTAPAACKCERPAVTHDADGSSSCVYCGHEPHTTAPPKRPRPRLTTPHDMAIELYARGYTATRDEAAQLVTDHPDQAAKLLAIHAR